jgi:phosphoribosylamine--glycine ligase
VTSGVASDPVDRPASSSAPPGGGSALRVVVVGSGGREHALAVALARAAEVIVCPGNPGMPRVGGPPDARGRSVGAVICSAADPADVDADLWVIGPEAPLVDGLADRLRAGGRLVLGPGADGARLEGSKTWMKELLDEAGVPTARHRSFDALEPAVAYLRTLPAPWVVKTDGLAAGKGVLVTDDLAAAEADVAAKLSGAAFGAAGRCVVIEEGLVGPELSLMALCDGVRAVALAPAQDYKRALDGDRGPNTGGVGAFSPVPSVDDALVEHVMDVAVRPTLATLARRGIDYRGVLYAGLMLTASGPRIIEFNVRFGDPETQVVMPRWQGDVGAVLAAAAAGDLGAVAPPTFGPDAAVCVVLAAAGYPGAPRAGDAVTGIAEAGSRPGVQVWTAGVAADPSGGGGLVTSGGRILAVGATGPDLAVARRRAYAGLAAVRCEGAHHRTDIALAAAADDAAVPAVPVVSRRPPSGARVPLTHLSSGKVRDIYAVDEETLLFVASDRMSAFDVVMAEPIPDKGRVLTAITAFWLDLLGDIAPSHLIGLEPPEGATVDGHDDLAGRTMVVRRADMLPVECIVRGYLSGSAWAEYRRSGTMHGARLPAGMEQSEQLPEPVFTPSTKATSGHDENISYEAAADLIGADLAAEARRISLAAYGRAAAHAAARGIIVADTKFELGVIDGRLCICDEVVTPDSSRFWPVDEWKPGVVPPAFDKQPLRDWLEATGWDKTPPPPHLPDDIVASTRSRYVEAYERITALSFTAWPGVTA